MPKLKYRQQNLYKNRIYYTGTQRKVDNLEKKFIYYMKKYSFPESEITHLSHTLRQIPLIEEKNIELVIIVLKFIIGENTKDFIGWAKREAGITLEEFNPDQEKYYLYAIFRYIVFLQKYLK